MPDGWRLSHNDEEEIADSSLCFDIDKVAYDRFVKPSHITLTDSVTRCVDILCSAFPLNRQISFSGITAEALESITTTLSEVQAHLHTPIMSSTILLGRSLKSDPRALQLAHSWFIDTA